MSVQCGYCGLSLWLNSKEKDHAAAAAAPVTTKPYGRFMTCLNIHLQFWIQLIWFKMCGKYEFYFSHTKKVERIHQAVSSREEKSGVKERGLSKDLWILLFVCAKDSGNFERTHIRKSLDRWYKSTWKRCAMFPSCIQGYAW